MKGKIIKIAYVLTPVDFAGSERVNLNFIENCNHNKFNIVPILLVRPWEKESYFYERVKDIVPNVEKIPVSGQSPEEGKDYFRVYKAFKKLNAIVKGGGFNIIHSHGYFADTISIPTARIQNVSSVSTVHGFIENNIRYRFYNIVNCFALRYSDRIIAVSEQIKSQLELRGVNPQKIKVIVNAVPNDLSNKSKNIDVSIARKHEIKDDELVLGYVGRLSPEKGLKVLVTALSHLSNLGVKYKMLLIGVGPQKEELVNLIKSYGLEGEIILTGFVENVRDYYLLMDIFILPSFNEGTPMSLLEAMACGTSVIATSVGGIPDIIDHQKNGILIPSNDPNSLYNAIVSLCEDPQNRKSLGENAILTVMRGYGIGTWIKRIQGEYENICM